MNGYLLNQNHLKLKTFCKLFKFLKSEWNEESISVTGCLFILDFEWNNVCMSFIKIFFPVKSFFYQLFYTYPYSSDKYYTDDNLYLSRKYLFFKVFIEKKSKQNI